MNGISSVIGQAHRIVTPEAIAAVEAIVKKNCWNTCMERNGDYKEKLSHCVPFVFNKLRDLTHPRTIS